MTVTDRRHRWRLAAAWLLVALGGACGGTGAVEMATVASPSVECFDAAVTPQQCSAADGGYTLSYPSGWYTVDRGPVPCRFFHPEPFRLPDVRRRAGSR